jgi:hypothetical protein
MTGVHFLSMVGFMSKASQLCMVGNVFYLGVILPVEFRGVIRGI